MHALVRVGVCMLRCQNLLRFQKTQPKCTPNALVRYRAGSEVLDLCFNNLYGI